MKQRYLNFSGAVTVIFFEKQIFKYMLIRFLFCSDIVQIGRDMRLNES